MVYSQIRYFLIKSIIIIVRISIKNYNFIAANHSASLIPSVLTEFRELNFH